MDRERTDGTGWEEPTQLVHHPDERELQVGDVIKNRFVLKELLGAGGMGMVFKALDRLKVEAEDRQPFVAVKIVSPDFQHYPISFKAFQREATKAQSLAHPNVVRVHDFDRDGDRAFITMECLSGRPLDKIMRERDRPLPQSKAIDLLRQVASALSFAHSNGIVHCDIKPSNLFVAGDGVVKVIDFGIAQAIRTADAAHTTFDVGTLRAVSVAYASPQILQGLKPEERDDVYSLACVAYELLTGQHPFGRVPATVALDQGLKPPRNEALSDIQWAALSRALAFDRNRRTRSVDRFISDLGDARRGRWPMMAAAGLALLVVGLGGVGTWVFYSAETKKQAAARLEPTMSVDPIPEAKDPRTAGPTVSAPKGTDGEGDRSGGIDDDPPPVSERPQRPSERGTDPKETRPPAPDLDDIRRRLASIDCAVLSVTAEGGRIKVEGYAAPGAIGKVQDLKTLEGVDDVVVRMVSLNPLHCATIDVLTPLLRANHQRIHTLDMDTDRILRDGDKLVVDIVSQLGGFIYIDYFSSDGTVVHLLPRPNQRDNRINAGDAITLGGGGGAGSWPVGPPYGTEMIAAVVAPEPLFPSGRKEIENAFVYRHDLQQALKHARDRARLEEFGADLSFVTIEPRLDNTPQQDQ